MKLIRLSFALIAAALFIFAGCDKQETSLQQNFIFVRPYCDTVVVGGFVGLAEKCFAVGDTVKGVDKGEMIRVRIAAHTKRNEGPPSNTSYQEFLDVPSVYLKKN